jgi:hypothetical protein
MAFGFPAHFSERRTYQLRQDELAAVVRSALEHSGWSYEVRSDEEFLASVPLSGWTWGEDFKVRFHPGGVVEAESKCVTVRLPQVFDFGRNRANVEKFFGMVEHAIGQAVHRSASPAAPREPAGRVERAAPRRTSAGTLLVGCFFALFAFGVLAYLVTSVVGLVTGDLYLPGRGGDTVVHGAWARAISAVTLAAFAWVIVRLLRGRRKTRG